MGSQKYRGQDSYERQRPCAVQMVKRRHPILMGWPRKWEPKIFANMATQRRPYRRAIYMDATLPRRGELIQSMYAGDSWIEGVGNPKIIRSPGGGPGTGLGEKQKSVDKWWGEKVPRTANPAMRPYLKNSLYLMPEQTPYEDALGAALEALEEEGSSQQSCEAKGVSESGRVETQLAPLASTIFQSDGGGFLDGRV